MSRIEVTATEYISGTEVGTVNDHRVVVRSPTHMVTICYGVNVVERGRGGYHKGIGKNAKSVDLEKLRSMMGDVGVEAWQAAMKKRGFGTALVDGGGAFPIPSGSRINDFRKAFYFTQRSGVVVDKCRQCGGDLAIQEQYCKPENPHDTRSMEEIQRGTNYAVTKVDYEFTRVRSYFTWDGTYRDPHFCSDRCGVEYGRRAIEAFEPLPVEKK